jgi:hypothetical protein
MTETKSGLWSREKNELSRNLCLSGGERDGQPEGRVCEGGARLLRPRTRGYGDDERGPGDGGQGRRRLAFVAHEVDLRIAGEAKRQSHALQRGYTTIKPCNKDKDTALTMLVPGNKSIPSSRA